LEYKNNLDDLRKEGAMDRKVFYLSLISVLFLVFSFCILNQTQAFAGQTNGLLNAMEAIGFAPVEKSGQTIPSAPGDDGDLQNGISFPEPRFTDNEDGTVTDNLTGLMWTTDAQQIAGLMNWSVALDACNDLEFAGYDDWRMPNVKEMLSLIDYGYYDPALTPGYPFINVPSYPGVYWTSTTLAVNNDAFHVPISNGTTNHVGKGELKYVWPVRSGN